MMFTRYAVASQKGRGKRVLEIGCGSGQGLGMLNREAKSVVGGDFSFALLQQARSHYGTRFPLVRLSADALPFRPDSFDLIICFEASYYVPDMERALDEFAECLSADGIVMFVNANPERVDFIPSPHSVHYHSADEFRDALRRRGFDVTVTGAFTVSEENGSAAKKAMSSLLSFSRRTLEALHLVPRTLRGRARLKRLIYGNLPTVPAEITPGFSDIAERTPLRPGPNRNFKVIYVEGARSNGY